VYSTFEMLTYLKKSNPDKIVTENWIRGAIRRREIPLPAKLAGRFVWTAQEISRLVNCLGLRLSLCTPSMKENQIQGI